MVIVEGPIPPGTISFSTEIIEKGATQTITIVMCNEGKHGARFKDAWGKWSCLLCGGKLDEL